MRSSILINLIVLVSLLSGAWSGYSCGVGKLRETDRQRAKAAEQRDKSLTLAEEYEKLLEKAEAAAMKCIYDLRATQVAAVQCLEMAEKLTEERNVCRKEHGRKR
jgi:hypothetical protein